MDLTPHPPDKTDLTTRSNNSYGRSRVVLLNERQWDYVQRRYRMSPRELEVARLVCQGFTNADMAEKLDVKPGTIKTHLRSIFAKVHARNKITLLLSFIDAATELGPAISRSNLTHTEEPNQGTEGKSSQGSIH